MLPSLCRPMTLSSREQTDLPVCHLQGKLDLTKRKKGKQSVARIMRKEIRSVDVS